MRESRELAATTEASSENTRLESAFITAARTFTSVDRRRKLRFPGTRGMGTFGEMGQIVAIRE
jgi:hypothetical protein